VCRKNLPNEERKNLIDLAGSYRSLLSFVRQCALHSIYIVHENSFFYNLDKLRKKEDGDNGRPSNQNEMKEVGLGLRHTSKKRKRPPCAFTLFKKSTGREISETFQIQRQKWSPKSIPCRCLAMP
jgi:hypothetical protein